MQDRVITESLLINGGSQWEQVQHTRLYYINSSEILDRELSFTCNRVRTV